MAQRTCLESTLGSGLSSDEWHQAARSLKTGGLGLRRASLHSPAAYLSSITACAKKCKEIDERFTWASGCAADALAAHNAMVDVSDELEWQSQLDDVVPVQQKSLSHAIDAKDMADHLGRLPASDRAALLSETLRGAYNFLEAVPTENLGLRMEPIHFRTELRRRLLMDLHISGDSFCVLCDQISDAKGRHDIMCSCGGDRTTRHNAARNLVASFAAQAALNPVLEKPALLPPSPEYPNADGRRPADVFLPTWFGGRPAALDFAVTCPCRQDLLRASGQTAGAAAALYASRKRAFLNTEADCERQGLRFVPMVAESSGGWRADALKTLQGIARAQSTRTGQRTAQVLEIYLQRLSMCIRRANAIATLRRDRPVAVNIGPALPAEGMEL